MNLLQMAKKTRIRARYIQKPASTISSCAEKGDESMQIIWGLTGIAFAGLVLCGLIQWRRKRRERATILKRLAIYSNLLEGGHRERHS